MEGQLTQLLRTISSTRSKLIDRVHVSLIDHALLFHGILIFSTIGTLIAVYAQIKSLTLFSMHPLCMILGTLIFLAEGIATYRNRVLVETFSPIMASSLRSKNRSIHQVMQIMGGSFLGLGALFIIANKIEFHKSIIPHTFHSIVGSFALFLVIVQVIVGHQKVEVLERNNTKTKRWHGDLGLFTWDILCIALVLGLLEFLRLSVFHIIVVILIIISWVSVHVQMRRKSADLEWLQTTEQIHSQENDHDDAGVINDQEKKDKILSSDVERGF